MIARLLPQGFKTTGTSNPAYPGYLMLAAHYLNDITFRQSDRGRFSAPYASGIE
jgi:hypothetical protein